MDHLKGLNDAQREAVLHTTGPNMVIAGAGSGKTRVLTVRIAHLMKQGVDPFAILALTFTNKAAKEMKARIGNLVGTGEARNLWMGTFHSVFARILRAEAERIGYPSDFTIYDTQDSRSVIKGILNEYKLDDKLYKPNQVHARISIAKNNLIGPLEYLQNAELMASDASTGREKMGELYKAYAERCFRAGAMDFDDLLFNTNLLFRDHPAAMLKYQQRFTHILVDEYQDTNIAQYNIVRTLSKRHENITVVGDDSQSIYGFRGANIQNILNFRKDHPDHALFKLEQNYRSTKNIVGAANSVIDKNKDQIKKTIWTDNAEGEKVKLHRTATDNEEGSFVAHDIFETRMQHQVANSGFAILYRTNAQSRSMEENLRKLNIPYRIYGGLSFYQRKEIKDLLAYFRLTCNPKDEEALKRVINYPARGIGKTTMDTLIVEAAEKDVAIWTLLTDHLGEIKVNEGIRKRLYDFTVMIRSFQTMVDDRSAYQLGEYVARTTGLLQDLYTDKTPEGVSRYENVQELLNGMKEFSDAGAEAGATNAASDPSAAVDPATGSEGEDLVRASGPGHTLSDFLIDVALLTDADNDDPNDNDRVSLMTIHSAKGLEFPYVYIVGLEEGLFPNQMAVNSREELEEERRLFYVALTRAEKRAQLTYATTRYRWGNLTPCEPSRFLEEIDPQYLEAPKVKERPWRSGEDRSGLAPPWARKEAPPTAPVKAPSRTRAPEKAPAFTTPLSKRNLKKISPTGAPVEATSTLGSIMPEGLEEGSTVEHERFGKGRVIKMEGTGPDVKATVYFPKAGQKSLLLRFAKLKVLDE